MIKNMGLTDRSVRTLLAVAGIISAATGTVTGAFGIVLYVLGAVFLLTSLVGFCPLYTIIGVSTCKTEAK